MCQHGRPGIKTNESLFQHVFSTKYGKVRIFKVRRVSLKSKNWVANPENKLCDANGSWYCAGQYPPALRPLIARRRNFAQLEDFNVKKDQDAKDYQEQYHKRMDGIKGGKSSGDGDAPSTKSVAVKYLGCTGAEADFGSDRVYEGGQYGASISLARTFAKEVGMKYFGISRSDNDGHLFAFSTLDSNRIKLSDSGCKQPCLDNENHKCGCADDLCGGLKAVKGKNNVRRWAVYEVLDKKKQRSKSKSAAKTEL